MSHACRAAVLLLMTSLALVCGRTAQAAPPTYLILVGPTDDAPAEPHHRAAFSGGHPTAHHGKHQAPASYGYPEPVSAVPYAYGWFGARPCRHFTRHTGYYRQYTEWSAQ